jgi:hypothetical protein
MSVQQLEEKIAGDLKWNKIENIPDFPLANFDEVKRGVEANKFSLGIDFTTSNQLAQWLYGQGHKFFFLILASTPIIVAITSLVLAFVLGNYWLLLGLILGFAGQLLSNPYNSSKNFWKPVVGTLFLVFLYGLWQGKETITYLSAFFVFPFFINSYLYGMNQGKLERVALQSEKIFIYLFQSGKLGLKDNSNEQMYWHREKAS